MDSKVMYSLSYGLFVLTAQEGAKDNGCIINTAAQVTTTPNRLTIAVNKSNFTHDMILRDGRFTLSVEPMDLKEELEDAVYTYTEFFRKEGITLQYTDGPEETLPISGDPERLRQVFCNLLDNADKHGGTGGRVDVSVVQEDASVVIRIRDYGPGVPEDELPFIKYKFYKGSSKARGSGIGLAVCDEIVTRHGGELLIGNAEGGGCVVTIRLPLDAAAMSGT